MRLTKISWYYHRLISMSFDEFLFRIGQQIRKYYELFFVSKKYYRNRIISLPEKLFFSPPIEYDFLFDGNTYPIFIESIDISQKIDWHKDISTGKKFPIKFSKFINVRDDQYGNAKYVWEVNRLNFLLYFALKYAQESQNKNFFLQRIIDIIKDWKENNPYLIGVNWYSNIEVNIRLIVFVFVWDIIDASSLINKNNDFKKFVEQIWLPLIYKHCEFSYNNPSKFSSANNHLIAEGAGLYIASTYWEFDKSVQWRKHSKEILEQEIIKQHSENGVNKEEAAEYIQFITDFFLLSYIIGTRKGDKFSDSFVDRLKKIFEYIYDFTDCDVNFPKYGDEDDGRVINLDFDNLGQSNNFSSLLLSGGILFDNERHIGKSKNYDIKNYLLFGEKIKKYRANRKENQESVFYSNEGHFFLRSYYGNKEIFMHFNAAPLGYLSIAAHGHADALSFSLNFDGKKIFIDSGTYTYHSEKEWRYYFIGTLAHNTVRIDKHNQAALGGPLLWRNHYSVNICEVESTDNRDIVSAEHNGYYRNGCKHKRTIDFNKEKLVVKVIDEIEVFDNSKHFIEIPFHLHPTVSVVKREKKIVINQIDRQIVLIPSHNLESKIIFGQQKPIMGWYSESFYKKEKTHVIYLFSIINKNSKFVTTINIGNFYEH